MQFSTLFLAAIACATGAVANLHTQAWCVTNGLQDNDPKNSDATQAACAQYKQRHTGNEQWDICPDCEIGVKDKDVQVCNSAAKHIGGDEWEEYCIQFGAEKGKAN
ncbi:hypothetical protein CcaCcLH18_03315 [Colletotrichum camelliae]|nr:hypothetical protein CcaCcLH18_03315 [Colletotrichum camelliae]